MNIKEIKKVWETITTSMRECFRPHEKDIAVIENFIKEFEQIQKDGVNYMSKCDGLVCAYSKVEKGSKDYERIKKLDNFIQYRMQENREMEYTLLYIASLIQKGNEVSEYAEINYFINHHIGMSLDDIVSDMKYEMEKNFVDDNQEQPYEQKRKGDYL